MRCLLALPLLLLASACAPDYSEQEARIDKLQAEIEALKAARPAAAAAAAPAPELGAQMLELQIRHARLWQAGASRDWVLMQFQLAELRENFKGVVESNGEHAALQPQRLAEVLPAMTDPALEEMQSAIDAHDGAKFDASYDKLSAACTACHAAADHGFLVIQRPKTPILDNLRAEPAAN